MRHAMAERDNVTADELLAMGRGRRELVLGRVIEMTPAGADHGYVAASLTIELGAYVKARDLGRVYTSSTGFLLRRDPDTVRAPDVTFVCKARVQRTEKFFSGAPDLAVEVLSPNDRASEMRVRIRDLLEAGTRRVWVLDPESGTATVHRPDGSAQEIGPDGTLNGEDLLPGFQIALAQLFAG